MKDRIEREKYTVGIMVQMYCKHNHSNTNFPCFDCDELIEFADQRIDKCIFHNDKPVCAECQVHCYRQEMREKIKTVMRFAGPRMLLRHPILGIRHLIDKRLYKYVDPKTHKTMNSQKPLD